MRFCAICGCPFREQREFNNREEGIAQSWLCELRGLYTSPDGITLTGVGRFRNPRFESHIAPPDPRARWDDPGHTDREEDAFGVLRSDTVNGRRGIIFHDSCWSLLRQAVHPAQVPLARLFEICDSLPLARFGHCLDWGHDYGGVLPLRGEERFPWEARPTESLLPSALSHSFCSACPLAGPEVDKILAQPPQAPAEQHLATVASTGSARAFAKDPFGSLPSELCRAIAHCLPVSDALNARCASRSFWSLFHDQQFWVSQFRGGSDRSWFFEAGARKGTGRDWRWLYRCTASARIGPGLRNRQRIWRLIEYILPILDLQLIQHPSVSLDTESRDWPMVSGRGLDHPFAACQPRRTQRVVVPDGISQISAWTVRVDTLEYIAGLSLTTNTPGETLELGYRTADPSRSVRVSWLAGFNLAVGSGGIHALQCIDGQTLEPSAWLGCPDDAPRTSRLALGTRVTALEVAFDAFRLVMIAQKAENASLDREDGFRRSAIWYPDIPPLTVSLNEKFYVSRQFYTGGYNPLFWCCFGGPGGIYLPHLTQVIVTCCRAAWVVMDFSFDIEVPAECRRFGRSISPRQSHRASFPVNGPGGEVIDKIEIWQHFPRDNSGAPEWFSQGGSLNMVKLSTNWGRTFVVGNRVAERDRRFEVTKEFSAAPGSAITGFFGHQRVDAGVGFGARLTSLGVLSEPCPKAYLGREKR